ncbi:two-component system response regulator LytT [Parabacteroides sp. PF5-5]|uniref:LytR/AlgR family response regulator transcription factor n=1 Tax=unclassified Parabacteroides TaxID=2649774 RepID=UPI0024744D62|nr:MULTISPECIES: LytTR family DNA-binding domain-containing protein [unclassified Parabacteroides]MDH6306915.1 two-component system response regulator LytT [Parabacteroides sp. PH5-39]MDH6317697.1 two-component system response regulator LytT [Parabacteroides sp. PF5-13]MDH6321716.1 two-component system response regulator LytT [Parabacteroides sp. PH5-13]MDH6325302.1 two-component system response regulator LytT [Parabacteroides sp. PH5-8]MDH6328882.1 two-component system response regulator LytT
MKAVIIEDETVATHTLKAVLAQNKVAPVEVVAELESIKESVDYFKSYPHPDIIFMDIHLADGSAFSIFEQVEIGAPVVFTTAYDEYALQAFQVSSIDYLLKPVTLEALERALNKLRLFDIEQRREHIRQTNQTIQDRHIIKSLLVMLPDKFYPLSVEEVLFFYTANEKVTAYTADGKEHPVDRTLDALSEQLDEALFFRANRQFIISRKAIKDVDLWFGSRLSVNLILPVPERIIISKVKSPLFKKWILLEP